MSHAGSAALIATVSGRVAAFLPRNVFSPAQDEMKVFIYMNVVNAVRDALSLQRIFSST